MKKKIVTCDICGKDITGENERYKFKHYEHSYCNMEIPDCLKWEQLDMCRLCFLRLCEFVRTEAKG